MLGIELSDRQKLAVDLGLLDRIQGAPSVMQGIIVYYNLESWVQGIHNYVHLRNFCFLKNRYNYKMTGFGAFKF